MTTAETSLSLRLYKSGESFYSDIQLENGKLRYTFFKDDEQRCAQWFRSEPCWDETDLQTIEFQLDPKQQAELAQLIETSGLMTLSGDVFGVQNLQQRAYSERLAVKMGKLERQLTYRSHPQAEPKPEAFAQVESALQAYLTTKIR